MRTKAVNNFEKDFYKLMNNSMFGTTMENVDKRIDVKIISKWQCEGKRFDARTLISSPYFHSCLTINEDLVIIQLNRSLVVYNKPMHIGFAILDLSKILMYDFHYNNIRKIYCDKAQLLYTDTDSLIYSIFTDDFYSDIKKDLTMFDTSDYPLSNKFNIKHVNKKVLSR